MSPPLVEVYLGLLLLFVALLPLGSTLLRLGEWAVRRRFLLSIPERALLSFYAGGGLLFVLASVRIPLFGSSLIVGVIAVGVLGFVVLQWRSAYGSARALLRWIGSAPGAALVVITLGVLALEVAATGYFAFGNSYDAGFQSLLVKLIVTQHTVPVTLAPYAPIGVLYPAGPAIWLSLPVLLFGWPIASAPVTVPLLFLSLAIVGGYCWGERLSGAGTPRGVAGGLILAGFMAVLASWPRFFIGGSYDFVLAFPLFLLVLGWLPAVAANRNWRAGDAAALGVVLGVSISLSLAIGEALLALALAFYLAHRVSGGWAQFSRSVRDLAILLGASLLFISRSLIGVAVWWGYPSHTLAPVGSLPYAPSPVPSLTISKAIGELDPFIIWKPKMSPIPFLALELQVLLAAGLVLLAVAALARPHPAISSIPRGWKTELPVVVVTMLALCALLLWIGSAPAGVPNVGGFVNLDEESLILFFGYQVIGVIPLLAAFELLYRDPDRPPATASEPHRPGAGSAIATARARAQRHRPRPYAGICVAVLVIAFGSGLGVTAVDGPAYLSGHLDMFANVSSEDVDALEWAGDHLPACSRVLVAPGSAGMYLPLYAELELVFPMIPTPANLSYSVAVSSLTQGLISNATVAALLQLNVTEVFATGQTSISYAPFAQEPLRESLIFATLFTEGDAGIYEFVPEATSAHCLPGD